MTQTTADLHDAGLDAAIKHYGGARHDWLDLSTGINPVPYPVPQLPVDAWITQPSAADFTRLAGYARRFWNVPDEAAIVASAGMSAMLSALPYLLDRDATAAKPPSFSTQKSDFEAAGWAIAQTHQNSLIAVLPNAPDVQIWPADQQSEPFTIIDASSYDVAPGTSMIHLATRPNTIILKSFDKFWGLGGLRLSFAIGDPVILDKFAALLGHWYLSGPAIAIGSEVLADPAWAEETRTRLAADGQRLDAIMSKQGAPVIGGTPLFRLYEVANAHAAQEHLAKHHIWTNVAPYADNWLRIGLPPPDRWAQLENAF